MRRLLIGMKCDENFISSGGVFIKILGPAVCLIGDKAADGTSATYDMVEGW